MLHWEIDKDLNTLVFLQYCTQAMCTAQAAQQGIHLKKNVTTARYLSKNRGKRFQVKISWLWGGALKTAQASIHTTITKTSNALGEDVCWQHQLRKKLWTTNWPEREIQFGRSNSDPVAKVFHLFNPGSPLLTLNLDMSSTHFIWAHNRQFEGKMGL